MRFSGKFIVIICLIVMNYTPLTGRLKAQIDPEKSRSGRSEQVVGGQPAAPGEYPWQAMLMTDTDHFYCGGSLIAPTWVLTAGHCLDHTIIREVVLGVHDRTLQTEEGRQTIPVKRVIVHPNFNRATYDNDIGLIELTESAIFTGTVNLVSLAFNSTDQRLFQPGVIATVTGWGATIENGALATVLQELSIPVVERETCNQIYNGEVTNNMLCVGVPEGGKDACQGDSGGPLVVQKEDGGAWKQIGIVSWGYGCARPQFYGVYVAVANYIDWIEQSIGTSLAKLNPVNNPPSIYNGDFEQGRNHGWVEQSAHGYELVQNQMPFSSHSGAYAAWLAGANNELSRLTQQVTVPTTSSVYLVYSYLIDSGDACGYDNAKLFINDKMVQTYPLCRTNQTQGWVKTAVDLSPYAGETIQVQFYAKTNEIQFSSFFLDDIQIQEEIDPATPVADNTQPTDDPDVGETINIHIYLPIIIE